MANEEDLVSQVSITGTEDSLAKLNAYADGGAQAFDKLNTAANTSAAGVQVAAAKIDAAGTQATKGFNNIGQAANSTRDVPGKIKDIENAISQFTSRLPALTQAIGRFSQRLAIVGTAAVAAGIGLATAAARVAKAVDGQNDSLAKNTQAQIDANNASLTAEEAQINYNESLRKLQTQLSQGKISYSDYTTAVKNLTTDYTDQRRVALLVASAQESVKQQNDALTKSLKDRQAYQALIDTFGGPLLNSLVSFGRQVETLHTQFINAFGPSAAAAVDIVAGALGRNSSAVSAFFQNASRQINTLLQNNGPQIQKLLENLGKAAASVFTGIINAAPGVIDFFNNALVPAISKVANVFNGVATAINSVFGTQLTGGSIVLIALLAQVTGSIRVMFALIRAGGAIFKGLIAIIESVGAAIGEIFGIKAVGQISKLGAAVVKGGGPIKSFLAIIRTAIPVITLLGETVAAALGVGFAPAIVIIGLVTAALVLLLTRVDWKAFGAAASSAITSIIAFLGQLLQGATNIARGIITGFQAVNSFFAGLGPAIVAFFVGAWAQVQQDAATAVAALTAAWNSVSAFFGGLVQTIVAFFSGLWAQVTAGVNTAVQTLLAAWNTATAGIKAAFDGVVSFIQGIPGTLQGVWDSIKQAIVDAFNTAVDTVKGLFQSLLANAKEFLQPILDLLNSIAQLAASALGGGDSPSVSAAGGGHIRGPGTTTSDSIPAWLSDNEFVMRAKAVSKYGTGLMHAINNGTFRMPRFNVGGLVSGMMGSQPRFAFADGGPVSGNTSSMRPINLSLFGEDFNGLLAPEDVGERLTKFAVARQTRAAGRKPAWVGRGRN